MTNTQHIPVLLDEVVDGLHLDKNARVIDATIGYGGHAEKILESIGPNGLLQGFDRDPVAIQASSNRLHRFSSHIQLVNEPFTNLDMHLDFFKNQPVSAILFDLGLSSPQVDSMQRGFSFMHDDELNMRFDSAIDKPTAHDFLMHASEVELADIFFIYGEERHARKIAHAIVNTRTKQPITGAVLRDICMRIYAKTYKKKSTTHPATRVWQALRIAVNAEFTLIEQALPKAFTILGRGGRLAVISFHSTEDALIKKIFRQWHKAPQPDLNSPLPEKFEPQARLITRKAIKPTDGELAHNPRARSAQLRIIEKI